MCIDVNCCVAMKVAHNFFYQRVIQWFVVENRHFTRYFLTFLQLDYFYLQSTLMLSSIAMNLPAQKLNINLETFSVSKAELWMQSKMSSKVDHLPAYFRNSSSSSCSIILEVVVLLPMNEEFLLLSEFGGKDADENFTFPHTPLCSLI